MKILAIDDQKLVLIPLQHTLENMGYTVQTTADGEQAKSIFTEFEPDLVVVDINMPKVNGIKLVEYIRKTKQSKVPIVILSGNTSDEVISQAFKLGINDYMKKPLSLNEICLRINNLIGSASINKTVATHQLVIQKRCVGVVIPCYNEEQRLLSNEFINFITKTSGYHLCFVNDGSKDNTLQVLQNLSKGREDYISVYDCEQNGGKAEAVRQGMLHMAKREDLDYIGFLDADLSTDLSDFDNLVSTIENADFKIVSGSRIARMGANITKESARKIISLTINYIIRKILKMDFKDTQCGAKIFKKEVINISFKKPFITKWLFDVEIFMRMRLHFGLEKATSYICEQPLKRWIHADGSKLSMKDSLKIVFQLFQIKMNYKPKKMIDFPTVKNFNPEFVMK